MAPTSDERREVAERMRKSVGISEFVRSVGIDPDGNDWLWKDVAARVADLIDPTCHNADDGVLGGFVCSECGYHVEQDTMDADFNAWEDLRHCPHCGARVTSGGER